MSWNPPSSSRMPRLWSLSMALFLVLTACGGSRHDADGHGDHGDHTEADAGRKGEHGGRVLEQGGHAIELRISEEGMPPKFQAWLYRDGKPLPPTAGSVEVALERLGGATERHALTPQADGSLTAATVVDEPHSFDVEVTAEIGGARLSWHYPSYEGRTTIAAEIAQEAGIRVAAAGAGVIADEHEVQGLLTPMEGRVAKVTARFPGPLRTLSAQVGDTVRAGQVLATVESNLSLTTYPLVSPISGIVLARNAALGSIASESTPLFEVADLSSLWVDLHVFGADAQHIRAGSAVEVTRLSDGAIAETVLERVLPGTATASQSTVARATLANDDGSWRPGSAVKARITIAQQQADLVVPLSALQTFGDQDVVFVRVGDAYEARPVTLGERDAERVAVVSGLRRGEEVVVRQSYLVKADIEKSGASHEH